jgi:CheY-like chemotaxis protein
MHPNATVTEALHEIDAAAERAAKLTAQMLMFSHKKQMQPQSINLNELVTQFGGMLMRSLGEGITQIAAEYNQAMQSGMLLRSLGEDIILEIQSGDTPLPVQADPVMVELVVLNLALNARDAMPHGGRLVIGTSLVEIKEADCRHNARARPGQFACITVEDTGCGISPETLAHLFEPFFTTKDTGEGAGLGLASAYGIVKQHEGWIEVESEPDKGSKFKVFLPVEVKKAAPVAPVKPAPQIGGKETILLVEDEPPLRHLAKMWLQRQGYCIYEAASGREALTVWEAHEPEIDLLLTDMMMPGGMSGRELAVKLLARKKGLRVIYSTGYSPDAFSQDLVLKEGLNFLGKPYHPNKLTETVRRCLDEPA